jgi:pyrroloquinoline-quinone synthase
MYSLTDKYDLLRHPFYEAWRDGKLTLEDLREYACEYYHQVFSFPVYLKTLADRLPDGELRKIVLKNLSDELGAQDEPRRSHDLLWVDFAVGTGAMAKDVLGRRPIQPITVLLRTFVKLARRGTPAEAVAAFYIYESQTPKIANALQKIYALDEVACRYFTLHSTVDVAHAMVWREQLQVLIHEDSSTATCALAAAEHVAKVLWEALDGIDALRLTRSCRSKAHLN